MADVPPADSDGDALRCVARDGSVDALAELQSRYPNWRLGQLIANVSDWAGQKVWDIEDAVLLAAAEDHLDSHTERNHTAGS